MREHLNSDYYEGLIRQWLSSRKEGAVIVIVEGKSDKKFFKKYFNENSAFFPVDGFQNVIAVLDKVEKDIKGVFGIIDADFRRIVKEDFKVKNIFMTDYHDVEMMTIASKAWEQVISHHSKTEKLTQFKEKHKQSVLDYILTLSYSIACFRFLNYKNDLGLKFKSGSDNKYKFIDYSMFINQNFSINENDLIKAIENKSEKQNFFNNHKDLLKDLLKDLDEIRKNNYDKFEFCNGHDVMNILSLALKKEIGSESISSNDLEEHFYIAYRLEDFIQTNLYKNLQDWEKENQFTVLKNNFSQNTSKEI